MAKKIIPGSGAAAPAGKPAHADGVSKPQLTASDRERLGQDVGRVASMLCAEVPA